MAQNAGVQPIQNITAMNNHPMNMNTHNAMMSPSAVMVSLWIRQLEHTMKIEYLQKNIKKISSKEYSA